MTTIYSARWLLPIPSAPIRDGAIAVEGDSIAAVGERRVIAEQFAGAQSHDYGDAVILPGLINAHSHLELTAMRGFLEKEEGDFFAWLRKLTLARLNFMTNEDLEDSASWGACEAVRAGITCVGDASDSALTTMRALIRIGLRGVVFQESFGPDARLVSENVEKLKAKVTELRTLQTPLVQAGVSPHAPYTVCAAQLEVIADYAVNENLPLMMHAAESEAEEQLLCQGSGLFAENLSSRGIEFPVPKCSVIEYLKLRGILNCRPLLAHCIRVDEDDIETLAITGSKVAHCPKSNTKLGHGRAPLLEFVERGIVVGLGSDSVASNNTCDLLEEARFAVLLSRTRNLNRNRRSIDATEVLQTATIGGARCLGLERKIGELRPGLQADFAVIALNGVHQLPVYDPVAAIVFSSSGSDVLLTVVAGREVYRDGAVTGADEKRLRARMLEIAKKLSSST